MTREPGALGARPVSELRDERRAPFPAHGQALLGTLAVDRTLDRAKRIDAERALLRDLPAMRAADYEET